MSRRNRVVLALFAFTVLAFAKEQPAQVIVWPESGTPVLRFRFGKFKEIGGIGGERTYQTDTTADNLGPKTISSATFSLYLFDKKRRVHYDLECWPQPNCEVSNHRSCSGDTSLPVPGFDQCACGNETTGGPKTVSITVNSVPQGAQVKLDGIDIGTSPKVVQVPVGSHMLEFRKEGFNPGKFPLEITPNDTSGGSVSYELGQSAHDTIELRDGTVLTGDLESLTGMDVVIRVGGTLQHYDRNQVKRISLVQRDSPRQ